ncbi:MAG: helix-turn-helix transcriptional regulator [Clostridia bacterium]|nr:helix-turn-helix transcriptional regulator [Clostridia bacterium]
MQTYVLSDFLEADLCIHTVKFVERYRHPNWNRTPAFPRLENGVNLLLSGAVEYDIGGTKVRHLPGQVFKIPCGIPYSGRKLDEEITEYYRIDFIADPAEYDRFPLPMIFQPSDLQQTIEAFDHVLTAYHTHTIGARMACRNALSSLLLMLAQDAAIHRYHYDDRSEAVKMTEYIRERITDPALRVENIAAAFHMSGTHLRRIFEAELGMTPSAYIAAQRLENACIRLRTERRTSIVRISESCGYASVYYFSAAFRRAMGCSPSEYRKRAFGETASPDETV